MADEEDPWAFDDAGDSDNKGPETPAGGGESAAAVSAAGGSVGGGSVGGGSVGGGSAGGGGSGAIPSTPSGEAATEEEAAPPPPPPEDDGYRKPVQLYRHWVRPKFLQYKYMYKYRTNYYDDVIDYLDKKQCGVAREIPRPQTWAERVLRSSDNTGRGLDYDSSSGKRDCHLTQTLAASIRAYNYHTKAYINQKYAHVL